MLHWGEGDEETEKSPASTVRVPSSSMGGSLRPEGHKMYVTRVLLLISYSYLYLQGTLQPTIIDLSTIVEADTSGISTSSGSHAPNSPFPSHYRSFPLCPGWSAAFHPPGCWPSAESDGYCTSVMHMHMDMELSTPKLGKALNGEEDHTARLWGRRVRGEVGRAGLGRICGVRFWRVRRQGLDGTQHRSFFPLLGSRASQNSLIVWFTHLVLLDITRVRCIPRMKPPATPSTIRHETKPQPH